MILVVSDPRTAMFTANAIRERAAQWRRNGLAAPPEVLELAAALLPQPSLSLRDRDAAEHARGLARERSARYRARQRGEDVPLRKPGRPGKRDEIAS